MKIVNFMLLLLSVTLSSWGSDFIRNLPDKNMLKVLTPENCKNMDAIIILKEQSFLIQNTEVNYRGYEFTGPSIIKTKILIVKLFNELAVKRYGSFEYEYPELFGDEIPNGFEVKARVLKSNGSVWEMPKDNISRIVSRKSSDGTPLARKVLFKVPNLTGGDVLQIEYQLKAAFSRTSSAIFFYNDRDYTLYSNLYITLPSKEDVKYLSFPEEAIGLPQISQISKSFGAGKTYFWSCQNLNPILDEPYSRPFADQSLMTAFIIEKRGSKYLADWQNLARYFFENYLDEDDIDVSEIERLGFSKNESDSLIDFDKVDDLYNSLRKSIVLHESNVLYPLSKEINSVFKTGKGDASDLAYIMFKILQKWNQKVNIVWIRDKRMGIYERSVPSTAWFDRLGVLVNINGKEKLYDFDRCISNQYEVPWFLKSVEIIVLDKYGCRHKKLKAGSKIRDNVYIENHVLGMDDGLNLRDSILIIYKGAPEEEFRGEHYEEENTDNLDEIKNTLRHTCLSEIESARINNFCEENEIRMEIDGISISNVETVEEYIGFKLTNQILRSFRDKIFSTRRHNDLIFEGPFKMQMNWKIAIPEGYKLYSILEDQKLAVSGKVTSTVIYDIKPDQINVSAHLNFLKSFISYKYFTDLINLIDKTLQYINNEIVLERV